MFTNNIISSNINNIHIFKKPNTIGTMDIGDETFNCYPLNDRGGKLLDISKMKGTLNKILFIQEFLQDKCANDTIDGIIIKKNLSIQQYNKLESKYNNYKFEYENNGGLVVIYKNLSTGIGHTICTNSLNEMFLRVNNLYTIKVLNSISDTSLILPQGYSRQPDCSYLPIGRPIWVPTVVIEVGISQSTRHLVDKCYTYFAKPLIEIVIGIKVFPKEVDGTFKAISFYFSRLGMVYNCQSIISFGSRRTSELEENLFLQLVNSQNQNLLTGVLSSNELINNTPNSQPFLINIPLATLLDGVVPPPQLLPNTEIASLPIDLFNLKHDLERIPINITLSTFPEFGGIDMKDPNGVHNDNQKFYVIFFIIILIVVKPIESVEWNDCSDSSDPFKIEKLEFSPEQPIAGQDSIISISGYLYKKLQMAKHN
ncbi:hypothetical protein ACTFIZ_005332 [Dictyostelium cf. discoideum]